MMDYILLSLMGASFLFVSLSALFIWKEKQFEEDRLKRGFNSLFIGILSLDLFLFVKTMDYALTLFTEASISLYVPYVELISISFMVIFFLVGMMVLNDVY